MARSQSMKVLAYVDGVARAAPHEHRGPQRLRRRGGHADVAEQVVADDPVGAVVDVDAVRVAVGGPDGRVLDHAVLDDAAVHAVRVREVHRALHELLARVEQAHVVEADAVAALLALELDRVVLDLAHRQVRDQHVLGVLAGDAVWDAGHGHAVADDHHVVAVAGRAAQGDVRDVVADAQGPGQVVGARLDHHRRVRRQARDRVLQAAQRRHGDDVAGGRRERRRGRRGHQGAGDSAPGRGTAVKGRPGRGASRPSTVGAAWPGNDPDHPSAQVHPLERRYALQGAARPPAFGRRHKPFRGWPGIPYMRGRGGDSGTQEERHRQPRPGRASGREALVARAQAGDIAAFEQLYRANVGRVYALCYRWPGTRPWPRSWRRTCSCGPGRGSARSGGRARSRPGCTRWR